MDKLTTLEPGLRKKGVKKMIKCSLKKEMKPHGTRIKSKPSYGALISFSGMQSALALFSQPRAFVSFVSTKEKKDDYWQQIIIKAREAGA